MSLEARILGKSLATRLANVWPMNGARQLVQCYDMTKDLLDP